MLDLRNLQIDVWRSGSISSSLSGSTKAIRITHIPTGCFVVREGNGSLIKMRDEALVELETLINANV